jgi:hypothetical protein
VRPFPQENYFKIVVHRDSGCPTPPATVVGMKIKTIGKRIVNTAKVINRFGNA